jgi:hypothetical protein
LAGKRRAEVLSLCLELWQKEMDHRVIVRTHRAIPGGRLECRQKLSSRSTSRSGQRKKRSR